MLCLMKRYVDVKKCVIKVIIISFYKKKKSSCVLVLHCSREGCVFHVKVRGPGGLG